MNRSDEDGIYRATIDCLAEACRTGQGQIGARRARAGVWNPHTDDEFQRAVNELMKGLSATDREIMAQLLSDAFVSGVHETLAVLHSKGIAPFDRAYEGDPIHDFIGRLNDWPWPMAGQRS